MNQIAFATLFTLAGLTAVAGAVTFSGNDAEPARLPVATTRSTAPHAAPDAIGGVNALLFARPFTLAESYANSWRADGPPVAAGWLVVLDVDRSLVEPRNEYEPILYAGDQTVERINLGHVSGRVVGVVPGPVDLDLELAEVPFWFGAAGLPEQVTAASIARDRVAAEKAGVTPFPAATLDAAREQGGGPLTLADHGALRRFAAELVQEWSPDEVELAEGILAPLVR